jgi:hypothetical protein
MEKYEEVELTVIAFDAGDVIVTSETTEPSETGVIVLPDL